MANLGAVLPRSFRMPVMDPEVVSGIKEPRYPALYLARRAGYLAVSPLMMGFMATNRVGLIAADANYLTNLGMSLTRYWQEYMSEHSMSFENGLRGAFRSGGGAAINFEFYGDIVDEEEGFSKELSSEWLFNIETTSRRKTGLWLSLHDNSPGINPDDPSHIYTRTSTGLTMDILGSDDVWRSVESYPLLERHNVYDTATMLLDLVERAHQAGVLEIRPGTLDL